MVDEEAMVDKPVGYWVAVVINTSRAHENIKIASLNCNLVSK